MNGLICGRCSAMAKDGVCPLCGKAKKLRTVREEDTVYLTSCEYIWTQTVEDLLRGEGIPYRRQALLGSGLITSIGEMAELYRYYVGAADYERALAALPDFSVGMTEEELNDYIDNEFDQQPNDPQDGEQ